MIRDYLYRYNKNLHINEKIGILLFIVSIILLLFTLSNLLNQSVCYDEAFTLHILNNSYFGMIKATSTDVHPPLYYIILKFVFNLFYLFKITFNEIILAKIVSIIPLTLLILFSAVKMRKDLGWLFVGIFAFCMVAMPQLLAYAIEIRMYSWGLLFVTLSFYYGYKITNNHEKSLKNEHINTNASSNKYWIFSTLFSVLAVYTHYFAGVAAAVIYLLLFVWLFLKNKKELKKWLLSTVASIMLYLPWLFILINQITSVTNYHWIPPITLDSLYSYLWFILSPNVSYSSIPNIEFSFYGILLLLGIIILLVYYLAINDEKRDFLILGAVVLVGTILFGVIVSIILRPVFSPRYIVPVLGCFWLTFSILFAKSYSKKIVLVPLMIIFLIAGTVTMISVVDDEKQNEIVDNQYRDMLSKITNENDTIIYIDFHIHYIYGEQYLLEDYENYKDPIYSMKKVEESLYKNKRVWLLVTDYEAESFNETLIENGYVIEKYLTFDTSKRIVQSRSLYTITKVDEAL